MAKAIYSENTTTIKTTVNLYSEVQRKIRKFTHDKVIKNQTEFINRSLAKSLAEIEKELALAELKTKIHAIKRVKSTTSIADTLDEVREESLKD
jgi:Arc/MetJ-type ribon-helix-helix transcriptional regulator